MSRTFTEDCKWGHVTCNGCPARIICTDAMGDYPIVALVTKGEYEPHETTIRYTKRGREFMLSMSDMDLCDAKPPIQQRTIWVNIYNDFTAAYISRQKAEFCAFPGRIACVQSDLEYFEGEGLTMEGKE